MEENQNIEKKSIRFLKDSKTDWNELAKDCVCFANGQGGFILIGIENDASVPPKEQKIGDRSLPEKIHQAVVHRTINVGIAVTIEIAENGAEFIKIQIFRNVQTIASTNDGRYYVRVSEECRPIPPDEMARLAAEKNAFVWEEQITKRVQYFDSEKIKEKQFLNEIRNSLRVSSFIKEKSDNELLEYYFLKKGEFLTNLGILWLGKRQDRATLLYAPAIQVIRYNEGEVKVWKLALDEYQYNPKELIIRVMEDVPDWQESTEISDGIFRKNIPSFPIEVVRELIVNALAHRTYTTRGDIFINIYHDRLEIHSPGSLPFGVTPQNILNQSIRRNEHLCRIFYDLGLMEKEGSGYDLIYSRLLSTGKPLPVVMDKDDRVTVTVRKQFISVQTVRLMDKADQEFNLRQKEIISLGLIAQHDSLSALEISRILNQNDEQGLRNWLGRLPSLGIILSRGKTKGKQYFINPDYLRKLNFKGKTTLKNIEDYRLEELITIDLTKYPKSSVSEIQERIGKEISIKKIQSVCYRLFNDGILNREGTLRWTKYSINKSM